MTVTMVPAEIAPGQPDLLAELPPRSGKALNKYRKNDVICGPGSKEGPKVHNLETGMVILKSPSLCGKEVGLDILGPEDIFGLEALIGPHTMFARAAEDCETFSWPAEEINRQQLIKPALAVAVGYTMTQQCIRFQNRIEQFATMNIAQRLAAFFKEKADRGVKEEDDTVLIPPFTHELLSDFTGTSREIVTHYMNAFRNEGYLRYSRSAIRVNNPKGLLQWTMELASKNRKSKKGIPEDEWMAS